MLNRCKLCLIMLIGIQNLYSQCFDEEITIDDFPYNHVADLAAEDAEDNWDMSEFYYPNGDQANVGSANGNDYAYKLTLTEPDTIYITTCDIQTNVDVQIAIYTTDCSDSTDDTPFNESWILYQDDSQSTPIYYLDETSETFTFQCQSGFESSPTWANMLPLVQLEAGTYYIVVDDRDGGNGTVKTWIGNALVVSDITTSDNYDEINYFFSEGVYGGEYLEIYNGNGIAVEPSDYSISIEPNGGNNVIPTISSLTNMDGNATSLGDNEIKVNIDLEGNPTGVEELTIGPADESSIFNSIGVPLLNPTGTTITLVDILKPTIYESTPEDNAVNIPRETDIVVTFTEEVRYKGTGDPVNITEGDNAQNCIQLVDDDTGTDLGFDIDSDDQITFTIDPDQSFNEYTNIRVSFSDDIIDLSGNELISDDIRFRTIDETPPTILSCNVATSNQFVTINFNEAVYATNYGSGGLTLEDLSYVFAQNGGNCSSVSVTGITNSSGSNLSGGETSLRATLALAGTPSGVETLVFSPANDASIFDGAGNPMEATQVTSALTLFASAVMESVSLADSNEYVDLTFSVGVFGNTEGSQPVYTSDIGIAIESNGGDASSVSVNNIIRTNGEVLTGGEEIIRILMSFDQLPTGQETITIAPSGESRIFSISGVAVPYSESFGPITLNDQGPPAGETNVSDGALDVDESAPLAISFTENIFFPDGSEVTAEALEEFVILKSGDSTGMDIPFNLTLTGSPPNLSVIPLEEFGSEETIYFAFNGILQDEGGNAVEFNYQINYTIRDYQPPTVDSTVFSSDNSYLDIIFDDEIFGTPEGTGVINKNDIVVFFQSNNSDVTECEITSLTRTDSNFLIGGETNIRVNFQYNSTPSGSETMVLHTTSDRAIYDESGNQMEYQPFTDTLRLNDIMPPSIDTISFSIDSYIALMESTPITFTFNETLDSLHYTITAKYADSVEFIVTLDDTSLQIILEPPFTSFDSITIYFDYLEDEAGLTTVDIAFTYLTPMLGDYNQDTLITYNDLWDLVENWELKNYNFELGPATGEAPHFVSTPDSKFDIEDGIAFMQMWAWYQKTYGEIIEDTARAGRSLEISRREDVIQIILDESAHSGQFQVSYDPGDVPIQFGNQGLGPGQLFVKSHQPEKGFSTLAFGRSGELERDTIRFIIRDSKQAMVLSYQIADETRSVVQQGSLKINSIIIPDKVSLFPAYPNPFNPTTTIRFNIPDVETRFITSLHIFDITGRVVETLANGMLEPGTQEIKWNAGKFGSGMYFARLNFGNETRIQKIILLK